MNWNSEYTKRLTDAGGTRAVVLTDGEGSVAEAVRLSDYGAATFAESVDLAMAAVEHCAATLELGEVVLSVQVCSSSTLLVGRFPDGDSVVVVSDETANIGLILSVLRRIVEDTQNAYGAAARAAR